MTPSNWFPTHQGTKFILCSLLACGASSTFAVDAGPATSKSTQRKKANLEVVVGNLAVAKANVSTCEKNIETLDKDIAKLSGLAKEYAAISGQYQSVEKDLSGRERENGRAIAHLRKYEKQLAAQKPPSSVQLNETQTKLQDREDIGKKLQTKLKELKQAQRDTLAHQKEVLGRLAPLEAQKKIWVNRLELAERDTKQFTDRKAALERELASTRDGLTPTQSSSSKGSEGRTDKRTD